MCENVDENLVCGVIRAQNMHCHTHADILQYIFMKLYPLDDKKRVI
jgi:hypothetical protein